MAYNQHRPQNGPPTHSAPQQRPRQQQQQHYPDPHGQPRSNGRPAPSSAYNQNAQAYNGSRSGNGSYNNGYNDHYSQNSQQQGGYSGSQQQYDHRQGSGVQQQYNYNGGPNDRQYNHSGRQSQDQHGYDDESEYEDDVYEEPWEEQDHQYNPPQPYTNQDRPPLQHAHTYAAPATHGEKDYQPHRGQQQITKNQESPTTVPWDNPFGAFPASKKKNGESENVQGSDTRAESRTAGTDGRPSTSHGTRQRAEPPRPHTSHGQRTSGRTDGYAPDAFEPRRQQETSGSYRSAGTGQISNMDGHSSRPQPQRSMTGPTPYTDSQSMSSQRRSAEHDQHEFVPQQLDRNNSFPAQSGYGNGHSLQNQRARTSPPRSRYQNTSMDNDTHVQQYLPQDNVDPSTYRGIPMAKTASLDVPDFDAMGHNIDQRTEHDLMTSPQMPPNSAYRKPTYQPTDPRRPNSNEQQNGGGYEADQLVSPLAQFSFGTSEHSSIPPSQQYQPSSQPDQTFDNGYYQQHPGSNAQQQRPQDAYQSSSAAAAAAAAATSAFPPRGASRANPPGKTAGRDYNQPYSGSMPAQPMRRPTHEQHNDRGGRGATNPANSANGQRNNYPDNRGNQRPAPPMSNQRPPPQNGPNQSAQRSGFDPRLQPRTASLPSQQQQQPLPPPRAQTSSSQQRPTANGQDYRNNSESSSYNVPGRTPSNSSHPVPFRPGLQQDSIPSTSSAPRSNTASNVPPRDTQSRAVDVNHGPVTIQELNMLRESFKANPNDHRLGLRFAKRLVEAAKVLASEGGRADPKQTDKNRERYVLDAHKIVKRLIEAGDPEAMFYMADCYGQGLLGLQPDQKEAFSLYQSAAKLGHAPSAYRVAVCCELGAEDGGGTRRDLQKAAQWYKRAATLGDLPGIYKLGMIQLQGLLGQPRNPQDAVTWLKRAAERADAENPHAVHELGLLYETAQPGDVIQRDENYALRLFTQAADLGYKHSQFRLGCAYEYGHMGCEIDSRRSIAWYTRAASQGEHQSEFALSGWYLTGSGPPPAGERPLLEQSDTEAYLWAKRAATSGLTTAEFAMGYYSEVGIGTKANIEEAKKWYFRAAAQNHPKARERLEELKRGGPRMQKGTSQQK